MIIYVELLNEGSKAYRPVPALRREENIYELQGFEIYDPEDEEWEFLPGTLVSVEKRKLQGEEVLVAVKQERKIL